MVPTKVESLLAELCVELGCCVSPLAAQRLIEHPPQDADAFAAAVLAAESCDDLRASRRVRERIAVHFRRWEEEATRSDLIDELARYAPKEPKE